MGAYCLLNRLWLLIGFLAGAISLQAQLKITSLTPSVCGFGKFSYEMDNHYGPNIVIYDGWFTLNVTDGANVGQIQNVGPGVHSLYMGVLSGTGDTSFSQTIYFTMTGSYFLGVNISTNPATCYNTGQIVFNPTSGNPPYRYSIDGGTTLQDYDVFSSLAGGTYPTYVIDNAGCTSSTSTEIVANNDLNFPPLTNIVGSCSGDSLFLWAFDNNADQITWTTDPPVNMSGTAQIVAPTVSTTYEVTGKRGNCSITQKKVVIVYPSPVANAGLDIQTCYEKTVNLQGSGGDAGAYYDWQPSTFLSDSTVATPVVDSPTRAITYTLRIYNGDGCVSKNVDSVTVAVTPSINVNAGKDTVVAVGQPFPLFASTSIPADQLTFQWTPATGLDNSMTQSPTADITQPQAISYIVQAMTTDGCSGSDTILVDVYAEATIFVPNAFTPNKDGHNDVLHWKTPGIKDFQNFSVFNRWGQQVFTSSNRDGGWDGTLNGRTLSAGAYVWMVQGIDYKGSVIQRRGTVMLIQ